MRLLHLLMTPVLLLWVLNLSPVAAQEKYPDRPIQVIIPAPAGGSLDIAARILQPRLSALLEVPVVLINRPGAGGMVAMSSLTKAAADGYTLAASATATLTAVRMISPELPYKIDDFIPVGNYAIDVDVVVVSADAPWKTFDELTDYARKNPGKLSSGIVGGSLSSLNMQVIKAALGLNTVDVPYAGSPPVIVAVLGKHVHLGSAAFSAAAPKIRDGSLRALATSALERLPLLPDVPTLSEKGVRQAHLVLAHGLYAPKGTPSSIVVILANALQQTIKDPSVSNALQKVGLTVRYDDTKTVREQLENENRVVTQFGLKPK